MQFSYITYDKAILNGKPIIKGTRISVEIILEWIISGASIENIYVKYPQLTKGSVEEALKYAAQFSKNEILIDELI